MKLPELAELPIYALAAMDIDDLQRVQTLSISYFDGPTKVQTNLRIESKTKQGNMVELVSSLGYKVELKEKPLFESVEGMESAKKRWRLNPRER